MNEDLRATLNRGDESEAAIIVPLCESTLSAHTKGLTFDVTGRRRPKAGANLQAQLAGGPVDGGVGRQGPHELLLGLRSAVGGILKPMFFRSSSVS
jgi:hypothetical protein